MTLSSILPVSSPRVVDARLPGRPPPPDRVRDRFRRRVLAVGAYTGLRHWLLVRGTMVLFAFTMLYVANGMAIGWKNAYDVTIGIKSPGHHSISAPALAWLLSVAGWLAAPAVCGAVAGVVISVAIRSRRRRPIGEALTKQGEPPH
jgi:hypothetical protein